MDETVDETLREVFVSSERLYEGKMVNLRRDIVLLPNGKQATREIVEHPGAVAVVPVLPDGSILMVCQFRHPVGLVLREIPAGKLSPGEDPDECARRELEEETGYRAGRLERKASVFTGPGFTDEVIHIYIADDLVKTKMNPDEDEFLAIERWTPQQIRQMIREGHICDAKTISGMYLLQDQ
jgi:ADP-ribose pyrophosphatase